MAYEDHAERAIRAGLAAVAAVGSLKTPSGAPLQSRIGIASGRVVVGDLAGGGVLDRGQVAGETPNLASRLQGAAESGEILIATIPGAWPDTLSNSKLSARASLKASRIACRCSG